MRKKLQDYLPPVLLTTCEFPLLCLTGQAEMDALISSTDEVLDCQFVTTAPLRGIERYEKIFNLIPKDTDTLDVRRARILAKMLTQLPYTIRMLRQMLDAICGEDSCTTELIHSAYRLIVHMREDVQDDQFAVYDLLTGVVPANILWEINIESTHDSTLGIACLMYMEDDLLLEQEIPESNFQPVLGTAIWMDQYDNIMIQGD